jgi:hypothetical protein
MRLFRKIFSAINLERVKYMVAGGVAVNLYGTKRATADLSSNSLGPRWSFSTRPCRRVLNRSETPSLIYKIRKNSQFFIIPIFTPSHSHLIFKKSEYLIEE